MSLQAIQLAAINSRLCFGEHGRGRYRVWLAGSSKPRFTHSVCQTIDALRPGSRASCLPRCRSVASRRASRNFWVKGGSLRGGAAGCRLRSPAVVDQGDGHGFEVAARLTGVRSRALWNSRVKLTSVSARLGGLGEVHDGVDLPFPGLGAVAMGQIVAGVINPQLPDGRLGEGAVTSGCACCQPSSSFWSPAIRHMMLSNTTRSRTTRLLDHGLDRGHRPGGVFSGWKFGTSSWLSKNSPAGLLPIRRTSVLGGAAP